MNEAEVRKRPQQERSRARVETILDVALDMMIEVGAENLAMREVARRAGVPIGSVYQYFPSKAAIIRELAKRNLDRVGLLLQEELARLLADFSGRPTPAQAVDRLVDALSGRYAAHPEEIAVWAAAQGDPILRQIDAQDTRQTAEFLTPPVMVILSLADRDEAFALSLLLAEVTVSAIRLSLAVESPLRDRVIDKLKMMLTATLEAHSAAP